MKVYKTDTSPAVLPKMDEPAQEKMPVDPAELLNSLKAKQLLYTQLKNEGLINQNRHLTLEKELKQTIQDLETLIPQLEAV